MSSAYKVKQSREQWKKKACCRGDDNRYLRKELRRIKNERDAYKTRAKEAEVRLKAHLSPPHKLPAVASKVDVVFMALQLFVVARIGFRAVSRVLGVLGAHLGITQAPCPQTGSLALSVVT